MPNNIAHFSIHADDCERAKTFYERVFGWTFEFPTNHGSSGGRQ